MRVKAASALAVTALVSATGVPGAFANESDPGGDDEVLTEMVPLDLFYGNFDSGHVLFAGMSPDDYCNGVAPPMAPAMVSERPDGTLRLKVRNVREPGD